MALRTSSLILINNLFTRERWTTYLHSHQVPVVVGSPFLRFFLDNHIQFASPHMHALIRSDVLRLARLILKVLDLVLQRGENQGNHRGPWQYSAVRRQPSKQGSDLWLCPVHLRSSWLSTTVFVKLKSVGVTLGRVTLPEVSCGVHRQCACVGGLAVRGTPSFLPLPATDVHSY